MKRRGFIGALLGLPLAAKAAEQLPPLLKKTIDKMPMSVATQSLTEERSPYGAQYLLEVPQYLLEECTPAAKAQLLAQCYLVEPCGRRGTVCLYSYRPIKIGDVVRATIK